MTTTTAAPTSAVDTLATRRTWVGLAVLTLPCLLVSMDASVLNLALPAISRALNPSSTQLLWIADVYGFFLAGSLITMGALGDRIGRRRLLFAGAAAFAVMSTLAAFSPTPATLIAARAIQGVAAATLMPSTLSLIRSMFTHQAQRTTAIGIWFAALSTGGALGPVIGGLLLDTFWWGAAFLISLPVMTLLLLVGPAVLPEVRPSGHRRLDVSSAALSLAGVLLIVGGIKEVTHSGHPLTATTLLIGGATVVAAFLSRQRRLTEPLLQLSLFRSAVFSTALATNALGFGVTFGLSLLTVQYLQLVLGLSPLVAGLWTIPSFAGFIAGASLTPLLIRRIPSRRLAPAALSVAAAGFGLITLTTPDGGLTCLIAGTIISALGLSPVFALATDTTVGAAPPDRAGAAAAMSETSTELGAALGLALLGSLGTAIYQHTIRAMIPPGLPPALADTARATLGGAHAIARKMPDDTAAALLNASHLALTHALQTTAAVSAAVVLAAALLTPILTRNNQRP